MRRLLRLVVHNWPLKLAAVALASVLYAGLVLSQDALEFPGQIPVAVENLPTDTFLLDPVPPVTNIRYFAPEGADPPSTGTFRAWIDLSGADARSGLVTVPIHVEAPGNPRIRVLGASPAFASVRLDPLVSKVVPVVIERGIVPAGLELGEALPDPSTVTVSGPESIIRQVVAARADVVIQPSGIDVAQDVALIPIDAVGNARSPADVEPATARIEIPVFSDRQTRSLPVAPVLIGTPADGWEIASIETSPSVVLVEGDADPLARLARADTEAVSVSGLSEATTFETGLDLPDGIDQVGSQPVTVRITFRPVSDSRTFTGGLQLRGSRSDLSYAVSTDRVLLTVGGRPSALDGVRGDRLVAVLDVTGLPPGTYDVPVTADLTTGLALVAASPPTVSVTIAAPAVPSPSPTPTPAPTGS